MTKVNDNKVEVWASIGITKNLGNYESLRLDAGAKMTCLSIEDEEAWKKLWHLLMLKLNQSCKNLTLKSSNEKKLERTSSLFK